MSISIEDRWSAAVHTMRDWAKTNTPWELKCNHLRSGGCFMYMTWQVTPRHGKLLWPTGPTKAAILVCSGPVSEEQGQKLVAEYASLDDPRHLIVLGTRVLPQADYTLCPDIAMHVSDLLPVDLVVLEYPPRPESAITGMQHLLTSWLARKQLTAAKHEEADIPAEVVYRRMAQASAPPTQEEMERDRTLADRPPV